MKKFLQEHADDICIVAGIVLFTIGMGMLRVYLAPITAGISLIIMGGILAWRGAPADSDPKDKG